MLIVTNNNISRFQFFNKVWVCSIVNHFKSITYKAHTPTLQVPIYRAPRPRVTTCANKALSAGPPAGAPRITTYYSDKFHPRRTAASRGILFIRSKLSLRYRRFPLRPLRRNPRRFSRRIRASAPRRLQPLCILRCSRGAALSCPPSISAW